MPRRLNRGILGLADITASTMANIGPAMSFFFGFALLASTAGVAAPLTIVAAAVAVILLGNTLAEFSRSIPSTGSFITFIGRTFGPITALTTAIVVSAGYMGGGPFRVRDRPASRGERVGSRRTVR